MRKVVTGLFISLDGVAEAPNKWQDEFDEDMGEAMGAQLATIDTILMGRITYQEWASYWPTSTDEPFATFINTVPKYVVSTTLSKVEWGNYNSSIHLLEGDLKEGIMKLKQMPGQDISVNGSPALVWSLLQLDLLDELRLMVHPVVVGEGKRLFKDSSTMKKLKLTENKTSRSGVAMMTYTPRR